MVILHIASIRDTAINGVHVAVPQHIRAQSEYAKVGFVNVLGEDIPAISNQFPYGDTFSVCGLPEPFCSPDLIVFHEVYKPAYLKLYRQAKSMGIPYIIVPHGCLTKGAQKKKHLKKMVGNILLFNRFIETAKAIQFLSAVELSESDFGKRKFIGTNGTPVPMKQKESFGRDNVRLAYIGRLDAYHKGLDILAEALGTVAGTLRECRCGLNVYGPDHLGRLDILRSLVEQNNVCDFVTLNGPVSGKEKEEVLLSSDIFVQTSRFEGMPLGILEALSYGLPCLVTRGTNLGEIIEKYDAGWVAETDARSVSETLLRALEERDRWEEKSRNAVRLIEENFRWDAVAKQTIEEYKKVLD